jgi:hypothetical protein
MPGSAASAPARFLSSTIGRAADSSSGARRGDLGQAFDDAGTITVTAKGFVARPPAQPCHGRGVARVTCEMKAAQALDRDDPAVVQARHGRRDGVDGGNRPSARIEEGELRSARRTRVRLGVKAAVERRAILGKAERALRKRGHAGRRAVVGQPARDRVPGTAMGAVGERITVAPVARIEHLAQAIAAGGAVRPDGVSQRNPAPPLDRVRDQSGLLLVQQDHFVAPQG